MIDLYPDRGKINSKKGTKLFFKGDAQGLLSLSEEQLEQAQSNHNTRKKQELTVLAETSARQAQIILEQSQIEA